MTQSRSEGFTLVETLVVVAMIGVIAVAIAGLFGVVVRTVPDTEARSDDARLLLGVTTWLSNDVTGTPMVPLSSADAFWDKEPGTTSGCAGTDPAGTNLVRLKWSENYAGSKTYVSSYRLVDKGDSSYIVRIYCLNGQPPAISKLSSDLLPIDEVEWTLGWKIQKRGGVDYVIGLVFELEGLAGDAPNSTLRVDATSKNFNETLDSPIPPPDYVPIPTPPPPPPPPNSAPVAGNVTATFQIGTTMTVTLDVSDDYDDVSVLEPTVTTPEGWTYFVDSADHRQVTIVPPDDVAEGTYPPIPYSVTDSGYPDTGPLTSNIAEITLTLTTSPIVTPEPPVITPISPEPSFQRDAPIAFDVSATDPDGDDAQLEVTLSIPDQATDPRFVGWSYHTDPTNNLRVVIDGGPFGAGTYPVTYRVTDETGLWAESTVTITLTPIPCPNVGWAPTDTSVTPPINPSSAARSATSGTATLLNNVRIAIVGAGDCKLDLRYTPSNTTYTKTFGATGFVDLPNTVELWSKDNPNETHTLQLVKDINTPSETVVTTRTMRTP